MKPETKRGRYLKAFGLNDDPFRDWVAETEHNELNDQAARRATIEPLYFWFYVAAQNEAGQYLPITYLRQDKHQIIFGEPGSGKTSLRLWLERECRAIPDKTLVVTYTPGEGELQPRTAIEHDRQLSRALISDLLIQGIEQREHLPAENRDAAINTLAQSLAAYGDLQRTTSSMIRDTLDKPDEPIEQQWHRLGRQAVRSAPLVAEPVDVQVLHKLQHALERPKPAPVGSGEFARVQQALALARAWGFERIYFLIDGIDNRATDAEKMVHYLLPLLDSIQIFAGEPVYYKLFLPRALRPSVEGYLSSRRSELYQSITRDTISWNTDTLKTLIVERFRAAGAPYITSLDDLAAEEIKGTLTQAVLHMAGGSPRRLVEVISRLIDVHLRARKEPHIDLLFTRSDVERTEREMASLTA